MTVYARVQRNYLGIVMDQIKKANGVRILTGIDPLSELQDLCIESRVKEDLLYILKHIESLNYPMFEYRVCGSKRLHIS